MRAAKASRHVFRGEPPQKKGDSPQQLLTLHAVGRRRSNKIDFEPWPFSKLRTDCCPPVTTTPIALHYQHRFTILYCTNCIVYDIKINTLSSDRSLADPNIYITLPYAIRLAALLLTRLSSSLYLNIIVSDKKKKDRRTVQVLADPHCRL